MKTDNPTKSNRFNLKKILIVLVIAIVAITGIIAVVSVENARKIKSDAIAELKLKEGFKLASGLTVEETAKALDKAGFVDKDEFLKAADNLSEDDFKYLDSNTDGYSKLEGFLFPTTYVVSKDADATMIVITMLNEFENAFTEEFRDRADEMGMSIRDIIIIASVIEQETDIDKERAEISSVIHNRLSLGKKIQGGTPDKPLCSPGIASIEAALYPVDSENIYYVPSDRLDGTHEFTADKTEYKELQKAFTDVLKK